MQKKVLLIFTIISLTICKINARSYNFHSGKDTNYIQSYDYYFSINLIGASKYIDIKLNDFNNSKELIFAPSPYFSTGIELDTKLMGFSFTPSFSTIHANSKKYGSTYQYDTKFNLNLSPVFFDLNILLYRGFYLKNTNNYTWSNNLANFYQSPNLLNLTIGLNAFYVMNNKKFSFTTPFNYAITQKKNAGSFITGVSYYYFDLRNDSTFVPSQIKNQISFSIDPSRASINYTTLNAGYGYTFVKKNFYLSNTILIGLGAAKVFLGNNTQTIQKNRNEPAFQIINRFGAGYDHGDWYTGLAYSYNDYFIINQSNADVEFDRIDMKFFIGKRFNYKKIYNSLIKRKKKVE